jgi:hypothetical protein
VPKDQGEEAKLTEGLWWPELRWKGEDDDDRRRRESGLVGKADAGGLRSAGLPGSPRVVPGEALHGLGGPAVHQRRAIAWGGLRLTGIRAAKRGSAGGSGG